MKPVPAIVAPAPLSAKEQAELQRTEHVIEQADRSFYDFGAGLRVIHQGKLYRPTTWERYCLERWEIGDQRAAQLMQAANAVDALKRKPYNCKVLPAREAHIRPLLVLEEADRAKAWGAALIAAGKRRVRATHVERAVQEILGRPHDAAPGEVSESVRDLIGELSPEGKLSLMERTEASAEASEDLGDEEEEQSSLARIEKAAAKLHKLVAGIDRRLVAEFERWLAKVRKRAA